MEGDGTLVGTFTGEVGDDETEGDSWDGDEGMAIGKEDVVGLGAPDRFAMTTAAAVTGGAGGVGVGEGVGRGVAAPGLGDGSGGPTFEVTCISIMRKCLNSWLT